MKKAQTEKKTQNKETEKVTLLTQSTSVNTKTTRLYDENQMNDESEYDSYFTSNTTPVTTAHREGEVWVEGVGGGEWMLSGPSGDASIAPPRTMHREKEEAEILVSEEVEILLLEENKNTAILDTGCARSTSGEDWMRAHIENVGQKDRLDIKRK